MKRNVIQTKKHPQYNPNTDEWDMVLLKLDAPVWEHDPVTLNFSSDIPAVGQALTVVGLGVLDEDETETDTLMEVDVQYVSDKTLREQ